MYLEKINSPLDLKKLNIEELKTLCQEIREEIISVVLKNGGHLSSNLGAVELTVAMHYVFDCPKDKFIFDVGHQTYTHKLLTGRYDRFNTLRQNKGISGFPRIEESEYDYFSTGHSGNAIAIAEGTVLSRDLNNENYKVVSLVGDGSIVNGVSLEALNNIKEKSQLLIILNDNNLSINKSVGTISKSLYKIRFNKNYLKTKESIKKFKKVPIIGPIVFYFFKGIQKLFKSFLGKLPFEEYGLKYIGPVDGHDLEDLITFLNKAKESNRPILLHTKTVKGKGYKEAEEHPDTYHSVSNNEVSNTFNNVLEKEMINIGKKNENVVCISAAMLSSTGLDSFSKEFPDRCFDVGIAEEYGVSLSAGLARANKKPYVAIYSSFLQRAFDQILDEICLNNLPVTFLIDRAGAVSFDGETHQGIFDLSYLSMMPNMSIYSPRDEECLKLALNDSLNYNHPFAIRYQKDSINNLKYDPSYKFGKWSELEEGKDIVIFANGNNMIKLALDVRDELLKHNKSIAVVDASFVKPLDVEMLNIYKDYKIVTLEDNVLIGGFGSMVSKVLNREILSFGHDDKFIENMNTSEIYAHSLITKENIISSILK